MKKAFITGASRGIGRGVALVLAEAGYDIAITYNSKESEAILLKEQVEAMGQKCFYYQASLEKDHVAEQVASKAIKDLGGLDLLVCNAGLTVHESILNLEEDLIDFVYKLNFRSYMMCAKVAANYMVGNQVQGSIVFISSTKGLSAHLEDNIYGSLKAGLNRSVQSIALELAGYNINVNALAPGATKVRGDVSEEGLREGYLANKIPMKRLGAVEDVGHLVKFIATPAGKYITGETIRIDGGLILPGMVEHE